MGNKTRRASFDKAAMQVHAKKAEESIRSHGNYEHVTVRAHGSHLLVETNQQEGKELVARLTSMGDGQFGLSFRNHNGKWEPMPFAGPLSQVAGDLVQTLGAFLERWEFSGGNSGTSH